MKNNLKFLLLINLANLSLKADFFALKKLRQTRSNNVVYVLYDLHATIEADANLTSKICAEIENIIDKKGTNHLKLYAYKVDEINKKIDLLRNNLPNLIKQQNDLINIVKTNRISLIDEDWWSVEMAELNLPIGATHSKWWGYIARKIGEEKKYKNFSYRVGPSPMSGIGRMLFGDFKVKKFVPINKNNYFYNPDDRSIAIHSTLNDEIDNQVKNAINRFFRKYKQKTIIVALGYSHSTNVAAHLISKWGYIEESYIINDDLAQQRKTSPIIDKLLKDIENNISCTNEMVSLGEIENHNEANYKLIAHPLDLDAIFKKELKK